jgi:serine/threonine protein kinase
MSEGQSAPKKIGDYSIIKVLGEGGMSVVYTAKQKHPNRTVAIKILRGGRFSTTASKRFHLEVEILGKLDHPWIAKIYDAGTYDDGNGATPYYVMELVENARELTPYLEEEKPNRRDLLKLFTMITSAVEHGHHRGIVHRDLKPGNILIDTKGEPKLIDFGVARSLDNNKVNDQAMTEAGRLVGTVQFMAPEQVDAKISDIDARCDVYALGAVLYQMLTGHLPRTLEGLPIYEAVRQICLESPVRPTTYDASIDQNLEAIIMKAIETDREKRYQTAGAFGRDMLRYLGDIPIKARKVTTTDRVKLFCKRHRKQIIVSSILALAAGLVLAGGLYFKSQSDVREEELLAQVDALSGELATLPEPAAEPETTPTIEPRWSLQTQPTQVLVSQNGKAIVSVLDNNYFACDDNGQQIKLPSMNVEPSQATCCISSSGNAAAFVSQNTYVVQLGTTPPTKKLIEGLHAAETIAIQGSTLACINSSGGVAIYIDGVKRRTATSTTGEFRVVSLAADEIHIIAATSGWVYLWDRTTFPKSPVQLQGVHDPILVSCSETEAFVVGSDGTVIVFEINTPNQLRNIQLGGAIDACAFGLHGKHLGFVSNGKPFVCEVETGLVNAIDWMPKTPIGIAIVEPRGILLWTEKGSFYQEQLD